MSYSLLHFGCLIIFISRISSQTTEEYDMDEFFEEARSDLRVLKHAKWVRPENSRHLIYFQAEAGRVRPHEILKDDYFNIRPEGAVRLKRNTEYCQWREVTTVSSLNKVQEMRGYKYEQIWTESIIDSTDFHEIEDHENPDVESFSDDHAATSQLIAGAYKLHQLLVMKLKSWHDIIPTWDILSNADYIRTIAFRRGFVNFGGKYFHKFHDRETISEMQEKMRLWLNQELDDDQLPDLDANPSKCQAGDIRIAFEAVLPGDITVLAKQKNARGDVGDASSLRLIADGFKTVDEMFEHERQKTAKAAEEMRRVDELEAKEKGRKARQRQARKDKRKTKKQKIKKSRKTGNVPSVEHNEL